MDNLKWQWTDLMPGDILRISKAFELEAERQLFNDWLKNWINKDIEILSYEIDGIEKEIYLETDCATGAFTINFDGCFWANNYNRIIVFDIVKLKED